VDPLQISFTILTVLELALVASAAVHAVSWRREPRAAALWIAISVLLPLIGPLAYFTLGVNRSVRRARRRMRDTLRRERCVACEIADRAARIGDLEPLARLGDAVADDPLVAGNVVEPLWNGEEAFPAMLEAIRGARRSVALCSYIFDCDEVGRRFVEALSEAAGRGVKVRLLVDGLGARGMLSKMGRLLRRHHLRAVSFDPIGFLPSRLVHINLRNHRKILVADGLVAFSGGINISARHLLENQARRDRCRDVHFRIRGPVAGQAMRAFAEDWRFATGESLSGDDWFPPHASEGTVISRGIPAGPDANLERIYWFVVGACQAARRSLLIVTPYFIPEQGLKHAVIAAALRGVDVRLVLPQVADHPVISWATTAYLWELLQAGVIVVRTPPPFDHSKLLVVDRRWTLFGSSNLDPRSLRLNFEFNAEAWCGELATSLTANVEALCEKGRRVTLEDVDRRSWLTRLRDGAAKLFSPYL
jgi:cardiolipin synthase